MSKREEKLKQKTPTKPVIIAKVGELGEEQLKQVSGGIVVTKLHDPSSTKLFDESVGGTPPAKP
jgi:hypothetical protein